MEELYVEGVATRDGPESCVGVREGAGEAWTGVRAGRVIEPRNERSGMPTRSNDAEGNIAGGANASRQWVPRGHRAAACAEPSCARTGRARALPVWLITGRAAWGTRWW